MKTTAVAFNLAETMANLGLMIWSKDILTGEVTFVTGNFEPVFEQPMDLIRLDPGILRNCILAEDQPFLEIFSKTLLTYHDETQEYRIQNPSGTVKWIRERKQLARNKSGEIIRLVVMLEEITDRKNEELRLAADEKTFRTLFDRSPAPCWIYDPATLGFLAVNEAATRFYGYTRDEFSRMSIRHIRPREDVDDLLEAIRNNNLEERSRRTWRHIRKDGSVLYVRLQACPVTFGGIAARMVQAHDITQQVLAGNQTEKLYRYLEKFQEAVSQNSLLALLDASGQVVFANPNLLEKTGRPSHEVIGQCWKIFMGSDNLLAPDPEIDEALAQIKTWKGERRFQGKGDYFWADCSFIPILDPTEMPGQYLFLANDISRLKDAERRNREFALKLHQTLEGVTDALFVVNRGWTITNLNHETERLFGISRENLLGKSLWDLLPEDETQHFFQFFRKAKKGRTTVEFEAWYAPLQGWFDISLYPSKAGMAVCFRNVTERRRKEEERKELMDQLIAQNRDLEEFTFITSHSLRAQIANISMLCAAIDGPGLTPANQEIFEKLFQCSGNLDSIIEDLNTILTIKDRNQKQPEKILVADCYQRALSRLSITYNPFRKFITASIDPELKCSGVKGYIETILVQLLTNAIRFRSERNELKVDVKAWREDRKTFLQVADNGRGLDTGKVEKQMFHLYKTFHPGSSGRGLGLYLCKTICDELGGSIQLESVPGGGTVVTVQLPCL